MRSPIATLLLLCIWLPGCSMVGLDAQKSFSCKAPPGISCSSLSGVYANAVADNLPGSTTKQVTVYGKNDQGKSNVLGGAPTTGTPVMSVPKVLRVWIAPWEDNRMVLARSVILVRCCRPRSLASRPQQEKNCRAIPRMDASLKANTTI